MRSTLIKFSVFAVAALIAFVVLANTMGNQVAGSTHNYAADFKNVSGLRVGDDVRAAGVRVGRVEGIDLRGGKIARVKFTLSDDQGLFDTTNIVIRYQNLLGQRYLSLTPGKEKGTRLKNDSVVPVAHTSPGFDLTALLNGFEPLFATLEPEQVNRLSESIMAVMQGQGGTIESLLAETAELTNHLADKDDVLGRVLDNLTPVLADIGGQDEQLDSTIQALQTLMTRLAAERKTIGDTIDGVTQLASVTADLTTDARPSLDADVASLRRTAKLFVDNLQTLTHAFATLPTTTDAFARPMSSGTWLDIYICNMEMTLRSGTIPLGPEGPYSAVCR
ncbi:MlaD family protein [Aeromicrobium panaciterrae]|uniref:MlaD family protein n=1 Tax=Aeromicrobium panaciterrae TaxID=363861 RepID=UPI0031DA81B2